MPTKITYATLGGEQLEDLHRELDRAIADLTGRQLIADVQRHGHIRTRKTRQQAVLNHAIGAADGFLGRLPDQHQSAVPGSPALRHDRGRARDGSHVQIVPAGVHHRNILSAVILGADLAGIGEAGLFLDRKGIKFGAQHHGWPGAILQNGGFIGRVD